MRYKTQSVARLTTWLVTENQKGRESSLLGRSAVSTDKQLPTFRSIACLGLQSTIVSSTPKRATLLKLLDPEDVGGAILRNVGNHSKQRSITEHLS